MATAPSRIAALGLALLLVPALGCSEFDGGTPSVVDAALPIADPDPDPAPGTPPAEPPPGVPPVDPPPMDPPPGAPPVDPPPMDPPPMDPPPMDPPPMDPPPMDPPMPIDDRQAFGETVYPVLTMKGDPGVPLPT